MPNDKLNKIEEKIDVIIDRLADVEKHMGVYNEQLKHHIYRTDLAEENLQELEKRMGPVTDHVKQVNVIIKVAVAVSGAIGAIAAIVKILEFIK